jgi:hypothetical protein
MNGFTVWFAITAVVGLFRGGVKIAWAKSCILPSHLTVTCFPYKRNLRDLGQNSNNMPTILTLPHNSAGTAVCTHFNLFSFQASENRLLIRCSYLLLQYLTGPLNTMVPLNTCIFLIHLQFLADILLSPSYLLMPYIGKWWFWTWKLFWSFAMKELVENGLCNRNWIY